MKRFLIALQFLTTLPVNIKSDLKPEDYGRSLAYFPLVGVLIGLLPALTLLLLDFLPGLVIAALILITYILITGGIHLDGLADTLDGFYGSHPKEKILEIMRDSRSGVMGVVGIVSILLLKFSLIAAFPRDMLWKTLVIMPLFARWSQVFACFSSSYARSEGKAKYFIEYAGKREFILASVFIAGLFILLLQSKGIILLLLSVLPITLVINYIKGRINGMTGDTIGAVSEIAEASVLFLALLIL